MAFCSKCGEHIGEEVRYCSRCGSPVHTPGPERPAQTPPGVPPVSERGHPAQPYPAFREKWRRFAREISSAAARAQPPGDRRFARIAGLAWAAGAVLVVLLVIASYSHDSSTPLTSAYPSYPSAPPNLTEAPRQERASELSADSSAPVILPNADDEARQAVRRVMTKDREAGEILSARIDGLSTDRVTDSKLDAFAKLIYSYVGDARETSLTDCPRDFAESYYRYVSAWSEAADSVDSHPHIPTEDEAVLEGFFRGLHGDPTGGVIELADTLQAYLARIQSAFDNVSKCQHEVEALAVRYGAE